MKPVPSPTDMQKFLAKMSQAHAQIDWVNVDLLNSLEKKELKQAY